MFDWYQNLDTTVVWLDIKIAVKYHQKSTNSIVLTSESRHNCCVICNQNLLWNITKKHKYYCWSCLIQTLISESRHNWCVTEAAITLPPRHPPWHPKSPIQKELYTLCPCTDRTQGSLVDKRITPWVLKTIETLPVPFHTASIGPSLNTGFVAPLVLTRYQCTHLCKHDTSTGFLQIIAL